ncbi:hypothetical protein [Bacillus sp. REN3]|uniref:hypothetical protein n=1 Tax=Bacillus sp. REN3 TaxID=2802440 RepID=UPI001FED326B|nr:hypothetical protein [Bacillus sp. REN3]
MPKNNEPDEMSKDLLKWLEEEDPFGLNEDINTILFKCKDCRKVDDVPDFVVADFQVDKKKGKMLKLNVLFVVGQC